MKVLFNLLERLHLKTKLMVGFSSGILFAIVIGIYALSSLSSMKNEMEGLYEKDLLGVSHVKEANVNLMYMGRALRQMMIAQDDLTRDKARAQLNKAREDMRTEMAEARKRIYRPEVIEQYEKFQRDFTIHNEYVEHAIALIEREKASPSAAAKYITGPDYIAAVNAADGGLIKLSEIKERSALVSLNKARALTDRTRLITLAVIMLGIVGAALFGILIGVTIKRPNDLLCRSIEELAAGKVDEPIPHTDYPNEIGIMARAIQVLQGIYRTANTQHWVKSHAAEIAGALQQAEEFRDLAQCAVSKIAPVIGAGHGAFYAADTEGNFSLLASYGYRERKHLSNSFRIGEGLVGQCAMERASILLTAPKDYIRIHSGLGEGPPACIMVLPIIHGERLLGVLEMASFQQFADREKAVLDALVPVLGTSMEILDRNLRTRELLASTQEQALRMEKQAAQLEEQTVEMEAQQAELLETENWFRSIIETAPDGMLVADADGQILLANPSAEKLFGYAPGELVGGKIEQLTPARLRDSHPEHRKAFLSEGRNRIMGAGPTITGVRKDGSEFDITVSLSTLPSRGGRGRCVSVSVRAT